MAFCEINESSRKVLNKHWPDVHIYTDVCKLSQEQLQADGIIDIDLICGGFPCQDISNAGKSIGIHGERSGLWKEFNRLIGEIKPKFVLIENVSALRSKGLTLVLQDLHENGYDAEWHCISASSLGAPHRRDRIWILAYPNSIGTQISIEGEHPSKQMLGGDGTDWSTRFREHWATEPSVCRVAHGLPNRSHRITQLGNSVVPFIPQLFGETINV